MIYRVMADAILILHLAFVLFVVLGGLAVLRWPRLVWLHVPAVLWGVLIEYTGWICPLTPLEVALRRLAGQVGYAGGFIEHYITAAIYPSGLTRRAQWILGTVAVVVNVLVYARLLRQRNADTGLPRGGGAA
jgi:hypothetical protein